MYRLIGQENNARIGRVTTSNGEFLTPCFMNVATSAAIKGGLSSLDLEKINCQVMLSNTYHLHVRPGDDVIKTMGGLGKFSGWKRPTLTDSGGFQVFSLASSRMITNEGVTFKSHIDGKELFIGPEESMRIQSNLASSIAMAFDECIDSKSDLKRVKDSSERTIMWLKRCKTEMNRLKDMDETINHEQQLFGINQGACDEQVRIDNMKSIVDIDLDGYAIGGLAVGETHEEMYNIISTVEEYMPKDKVRYLMGVGTPMNILESVARGVDLFDCVLPTRNGRHGHFFTNVGVINIMNQKYILDNNPIDEECDCEVCRNYSRAYIRHLFMAKEPLALRFGAYHNLYFYNNFMKRIRDAIEVGEFNNLLVSSRGVIDRRI